MSLVRARESVVLGQRDASRYWQNFAPDTTLDCLRGKYTIGTLEVVSTRCPYVQAVLHAVLIELQYRRDAGRFEAIPHPLGQDNTVRYHIDCTRRDSGASLPSARARGQSMRSE